jgi:glutamyl-tRNA reductase
VINRSQAPLDALTQQYGVRGVLWDQIEAVLTTHPVVFVATGAPHIVLNQENFIHLPAFPRLIIDIAVPRNVDCAVGNLSNTQLFNTDHLAGVLGDSLKQQAALIQKAQQIITQEYQAFYDWQIALPARDTITRLRAKIEALRQAEMLLPESISAQLSEASALEDSELSATLETISRRLINKILHTPTVRLKSGATSSEEIRRRAALLDQLFALEEEVFYGRNETQSPLHNLTLVYGN